MELACHLSYLTLIPVKEYSSPCAPDDFKKIPKVLKAAKSDNQKIVTESEPYQTKESGAEQNRFEEEKKQESLF